MENKCISVIIPVYQVKPYLTKCVDSVIRQTYKNMEIILVDDGSTDGSSEICDSYKKIDNRIKVIHKENGGLSSARNMGIDIASGEYLAFIDSDDWINPRFIQVLYENCEQQCAGIAQCGYYEVLDESEIEDTQNSSAAVYKSREFSLAEFTILSWRINLTWNKIYKSDLFQGIRFPMGKIHEDELTTYQLIWKADKIITLSERLYYYRQREDSIMGREFTYKRLDAGDAYKEKLMFYQQKGEMELARLNQEKYLYWIKQQLDTLQKIDNVDYHIIQYLKGEKKKTENMLLGNGRNIKGDVNHSFLFPFDQVKAGSKIMLYGAGAVGRQFYKQVTALNYCSILQWIDKNAQEYQKEGIPVSEIKQISNIADQCNKVVIAINSNMIAGQVICDLVNNHKVPREKIIYQVVKV